MKALSFLLMGMVCMIADAGPLHIYQPANDQNRLVAKANATNTDSAVTWADIRAQQQSAVDALQAIDVSATGTLGVAIAAIDPSTLTGAAKTQAQATKSALQTLRQTLQDIKAAIRQNNIEVRRLVRKLKAESDNRKAITGQ